MLRVQSIQLISPIDGALAQQSVSLKGQQGGNQARRKNTDHRVLNQLQIVLAFAPLLNQQEMDRAGKFWFLMADLTL